MIRKIVYSPILFFVLMLFIGCNNPQMGDDSSYEVYKNKGDTLIKKVQLDSAYFYYNLAKESCNDSKDENHTYALLQMATIQQHISDYYGSEETVTEALDHTKDTIYKPYLYNMLAVTYDKQRKYDDALLYYAKAFQTFRDSINKAIALSNIGLIYREKGQYNKAIRIFKPLLENRHLKTNQFEIARVLDNLGYTQFKINDQAAYSNLSESLRLRDSLNDIIGSIPSYIHLSEFFLATDKAKAKMLAEKALALANTIKSPDDRLESLRWLAKSTDPATAQKYASDYITLNDSLSFARSSAKNQYFKIKHDFAKSKKAREEAEFMTRKITVALIVITLLLSVMIFLVRYVNHQKLKASVYNTETRISKKIHDELANDVYHAIAFTETQNLEQPDNKEALLDNLSNIYSKARDISQTNSEVYTDDRYPDSLLDLINSFSGNDINIITKNYDTVDWNKINEHSKNALYRVIQELLVNMKKHSEANLVMLDFESKPKVLEIRYSDNGKGIDPVKFSKKGLQYAENRIHAVKGTFTFDKKATKGFRVTVQIPK